MTRVETYYGRLLKRGSHAPLAEQDVRALSFEAAATKAKK